ncbi:hypothetical protein RB195_000887 [Necator americanus]|uniref:Uncharacterized protein n=1 Tax=Necator americanus TaxID=51031 RepID=A0ABR1DD39_NECAM
MKKGSLVIKTTNGVAVGDITLSIWKLHINILLSQQASSAPERERLRRPVYIGGIRVEMLKSPYFWLWGRIAWASKVVTETRLCLFTL